MDYQSDARLKVRFIALLMLAEGVELHTTASVVGKSIKTIENWFYQYTTKGIASPMCLDSYFWTILSIDSKS